MFELEDLYDYAIDGAFKSLEEFLEMAPTLGYDGLFDYLEEGTFKDVAELEASNVLGLKKKRGRITWHFSNGRYGCRYYNTSGGGWILGYFTSRNS